MRSGNQDDARWMRLALHAARKGVGLTSPNPSVGAIVVRDNKVMGQGWHRAAGEPHAEIVAINNSKRTAGTTIYVTLEPCSTVGRTPACCDALVEARFSRVVYGSTDPNPKHSGAARRRLEKAGVQVTPYVLRDECDELIRPFAKTITTGLPYVIAKAAISLDGKITRPAGESQWLTSEEAREDVQKLRAKCDAILVGAETVRSDNPRLTIRGKHKKQQKEQPWRLVLTKSGKLPAMAHLFTDEFKERTLVFKNRSLREVLKNLAKRGANSILVEGGGSVMGQFFKQGLVDEFQFYLAPLISGHGEPVIRPENFSKKSGQLIFTEIKKIGPDLRIKGKPAPKTNE